jgi:hypothetical protein
MAILPFSRADNGQTKQHLADALDRMIARLVDQGLYYRGPDRRTDERHSVSLSAKVVPLDEHLNPIGPAVLATTRDVSSSGISIIHSDPFEGDCRFVAIELQEADGVNIRATVEVLRNGPSGPYFEIAGRFVTKVRSLDPFARHN